MIPRLMGVALCHSLLFLMAVRIIQSAWPPGIFWPLLSLAVVLGYMSADFASGLVHWFFDEICGEATPLLGGVARPFREHHKDPEDILKHDFLYTNGGACLALAPILLVVYLLGGPAKEDLLSIWCHTLFFSFALGLAWTNQFHKWAHCSCPPRIVGFLQALGVILSKSHHDHHHQAPFSRAYCITAGWCNPVLDKFQLLARLRCAIKGD